MQILIDGYNLLHAVVSVPERLGPDGLRKLRHRLLNDLAHRLGPLDAARTTVVFDAADPPADRPRRSIHKAMTIVYAVGEPDADSGIERLIAEHSSPKTLTVVSTDHRVRRAALRRKAKALTADEFWSSLGRKRPTAAEPPPPVARPDPILTPEESAFWQEQFRDVIESPEARDVGRRPDFLPSDEEIERIEREIADEDDFS